MSTVLDATPAASAPLWKGAALAAHALHVVLPFQIPRGAVGLQPGGKNWDPDFHDLAAGVCRDWPLPFQQLSKSFPVAAWMEADTIARFTDGDWLPGPLHRRAAADSDGATRARREAWNAQPVWQRVARGPSLDFHPYIRAIFGYRDGEPATLPEAAQSAHGQFSGLPTLQLGSAACQLLQGAVGRRGAGLNLGLPPAACARLGRPPDSALRLHIDDVLLQLFSSGYGLLVFRVAVAWDRDDAPLTADGLLEATHLLSRNPSMRGAGKLQWAGFPECAGPGWTEIADRLLPLAGLRPLYREQTRFFSYSYAQSAEPLPDEVLRDYASRLACHFTEHYALGVPREVTTLYAPFAGLSHAMACEGGCTVLAGDRGVPFLRDYGTGALRQAYLPLALLSYHEYLYLLGMAQSVQLPAAMRHDDDRGASMLEDWREQLVLFHVDFRFSVASSVSLHNRTLCAWREALQLDRLLDEVTRDVEKSEMVYRARRERRFKWAQALASSIAAMLLAWQFVSAALGHVYGDVGLKTSLAAGATTDPAKKEALLQSYNQQMDEKDRIELLAGALALAIGVMAGRFVYRRPF